MKTVVRLTAAVAAGFLGGLLAAYVKSHKERPREETREDRLLLEDASAIGARHALTVLQERPAFAMDELKQPYAMMYDIDGLRSTRVGDEPSLLEEPRPDSPS
jgi:hypothetical protein